MAACTVLSIEEIERVTSALKATVLSGYGPSFRHTLISTQTGKLMITNNGSQILRTTSVDHPVGKYIVSCTSDYQRQYGDSSKTFIIMLSELVYRSSLIIRSSSDVEKASSRLHLLADLEHLLSATLPQLFKAMEIYCVRYNVSNDAELTAGLNGLIGGSLNSHLLEYDCSHFSRLLTTWVMGWYRSLNEGSTFTKLLDMLVDYSSVIVVENPGKPASSSQILPGLLISRGFCNQGQMSINPPDNQAIKLLVMNCQIESIEDSMLDQQVEFQLPDQNHQETLSKIMGYKRLRTNAFLNLVRQMGINLIITTYSLSTLEKTQCSRYGIATIHTVPEPEIEYVSNILNIQILSSTLELTTSNIGEARSCQEISFGNQSYVHIEPDPVCLSTQPSCLIVCGPTDGMSHQMHQLVNASLKTVRISLTSDNQMLNIRGSMSPLAVSTENLSTCSSAHKSNYTSEGGDSGVCLDPSDQLQFSPVSTHHGIDRCSSQGYSHTEQSRLLDCEGGDADSGDKMTCIAVGGAFEFCLHETITQYLSTQRAGAPGTTALSVLKQSLLVIPQLIHTNAYYVAKPRWLSTLDDIKLSVRSGRVRSVDPTDGTATSIKLLHPLHSKQQLVVSALAALRQLLKVERIL